MQEKPIYWRKKVLFGDLGSVRIVKNCDLGLKNAALSSASGSIFKTLVTVFHHTDLPAGK